MDDYIKDTDLYNSLVNYKFFELATRCLKCYGPIKSYDCATCGSCYYCDEEDEDEEDEDEE